ncbi:hypothetical protein E5163_07180 [Marinicauda algicola]|uniref:STAS/SEC14 domain-containing protein n=1 Tax=Marinicauda algicola TaxID=2029849 RepID=A0A4S2H172_9PROT|nr:hypothetical protein [Marinicauda algicola]TGY88912.1 hypothetical protein E5163_07180 [Marinicauda algicola]
MQDSARPEADYSYDRELDALRVSVYGPRGYDQARAHFAKVIARMRAEGTQRLLLDLTGASYEFDLEQSIEAFWKIAEASEGNQIALVMDLSRREQGIVLQTVGTARWNLIRLFHDRESAEAWLRETAD